jgi:hypothetical protein
LNPIEDKETANRRPMGLEAIEKNGMEKKENFVVCINNQDYPASLELNKIYRAIPDADAEQDGDLRVIDESGEDYLYPAEWFVPVTLPHEKFDYTKWRGGLFEDLTVEDISRKAMELQRNIPSER